MRADVCIVRRCFVGKIEHINVWEKSVKRDFVLLAARRHLNPFFRAWQEPMTMSSAPALFSFDPYGTAEAVPWYNLRDPAWAASE